jgi:hypothetical protein
MIEETPLHPSHQEVARLGYRPIPIIPPGAPLSPNSAIKPEDRGKIPGRVNAEGAWAGFDWLNNRPTLRGMARWYESGAGVGIVCGEPSGVIGLDIDCLDAEAAAEVQRIAGARLGVAPIRIGRAPKSLLVFRVDPFSDPIRWRKIAFVVRDQEQLVEVRGLGQQFVAYGIHPGTKEPYEWPETQGEIPALSGLPVVDADDIADFFELLSTHIESDMGGVIVKRSTGATGAGLDRQGFDQSDLSAASDTLTELEDAVSYIKNSSDEFPARDDYIKMGCAIKAAFHNDLPLGEKVWLDWAYRWEDGAHGDEEPERDWKRMQPPFEIGATYLIELARAHGWKDAHLRFERITTAGDDPEADSERAAADDEGVPFWDRFVWIEELERFVDLRDRVLLNKSQFAVRFPHIGKGPFTQENAATVYLENTAMRRVVRAKTYRPGQPVMVIEQRQSAVNTWYPGPIHSDDPDYGWLPMIKAGRVPCMDEDVSPFIKLAAHLFPDDRERGLLLDWMAFQIQHPGVKCGWHPVVGGIQGIGKDSLFLPLLMGLGDHNTVQISPADLAGQWTFWAQEKQLVVVQEMNNFHRKEVMDKIKPYLTSPPERVSINIKGMPQYDQPNVVNLVFFTNHPDAVALERSDRRFYILWSIASALSEHWFAGYYRWVKKQDGAAAVCAWLAARDLSGFDNNGRAPATAAKEMMRREALAPIEAELTEAIDERADVFETRDLLTVRQIVGWLRHTCGYASKEVHPTRVGKALREVRGAVSLGRIRSEGQRFRVWAVRHADKYIGLDSEQLGAEYESQLNNQINKDLKQTFKKHGKPGPDSGKKGGNNDD